MISTPVKFTSTVYVDSGCASLIPNLELAPKGICLITVLAKNFVWLLTVEEGTKEFH